MEATKRRKAEKETSGAVTASASFRWIRLNLRSFCYVATFATSVFAVFLVLCFRAPSFLKPQNLVAGGGGGGGVFSGQV